ncbi:cation-transporting P-type ATPase [bacterium]|nr:cation-transporting P-type ATPase [bacterium]
MEERGWHVMSAEDVLRVVRGTREGLSLAQIEERQRIYGKNVLPERDRISPLRIFFRQFFSPLVALLFFAGGVSFFLGDIIDLLSILLVLFLNALLGFFQEYRADQRMRALRAMVGTLATVERAGQVLQIPAEELVPGDVLFLRAGMKVGADARLFAVNDLASHEAALTGESREVEKCTHALPPSISLFERSNMVFMGTAISRGTGKALVVATAGQTVFADIARETQQTTGGASGFATELKKMGFLLSIIVFLLSGGLFLVGILRGEDVFFMLQVSIALAVAAIPEGLLIATTVALAVALQRMAKEKVLVRELGVPERMSAVNVLCVDKTGTLTEGNMKVEVCDTSRPEMVRLALSALTEQSRKHASLALSLTEQALAEYIVRKGIEDVAVMQSVPFSSVKKFSEVTIQRERHVHTFRLGAPEMLFPLLSEESSVVVALRERAHALTRKGYRVLMFLERESVSEHFVFLAFFGIADPLRDDAQEMVARIQEQGVRLLMLTGDHRETAQAIARRLGMEGECVHGDELRGLSDADLARLLRKVSVIARMVPQDKLRIVRALQADGAVVGMTGDGVNDGPALAAADVGIALHSGTDVAREVADVVLMDDRLATISHALEEGRGTFLALQRISAYLLMLSLAKMGVFTFALLFGVPLPLSPVQLLWLNVVTDGILALGLATFVSYDALDVALPRNKMEGIFSLPFRRFLVIAVGILTLPLCMMFLFTLSLSGPQAAGIFFAAFVLDALVMLWFFARIKSVHLGVSLFIISFLSLGASFFPYILFSHDLSFPSPGIFLLLFFISLLKCVFLWAVWRVILVRKASLSPALVS